MSVRAKVTANTLASRLIRALAIIADGIFLAAIFDLSVRITTSHWPLGDFSNIERLVRLGPGSLSSAAVTKIALPATIIFWQLIALSFIYFTFFEGMGRRATPGKLLFSLQVADLRGFPVSFMRSFGRNMWRFFVPILCGAVTLGAMLYLQSKNASPVEQGLALLNSIYFSALITAGSAVVSFICMFVTRRTQTVYDLLADTVVVAEEDRVLRGAILGILTGGTFVMMSFAARYFFG